MTVRAIDVSHWQGPIDWHAVKASGVRGAWIKVGGADGGLYADSMASANIAGATAAGMPFGTYYYFDARPGEAVTQARHAVSVGHGKGTLWPTADLEENPHGLSQGQLDVWLSDCCAEVRRLTGRDSVWYGNVNVGIGHTPSAPSCPLWIANYGRVDTPGTTPPTNWSPAVPPRYPGWDIWQFNSKTTVPGIPDATVDQDAVTDEFWARMTAPPPIPQEDLMSKAFIVPADNKALWWRVRSDGFATLVRQSLDADDLIGLTCCGEIEGVVSLTAGVVGYGIDQGSIIKWLYGLPTVPPVTTYAQVIGEEERLMGYMRDQIAAKLPDVHT